MRKQFFLILLALMVLFLHSARADLNESLRKSINDSLPAVGSLESWQVQIFRDEVLATPIRFVKDYRQGAQGAVDAQVDLEAIRNYLVFSNKKLIQAGTGTFGRVGVLLYGAPDCPKCQTAINDLKKGVTLRFERRGFQTLQIPVRDLGTPDQLKALSVRALQERAVLKLKDKNIMGVFVLQIRMKTGSTEDVDHGDEINYNLQSLFVLRLGSGENKDLRQESSVEIMANASMSDAFSGLWVEIFTALGRTFLSGKNESQVAAAASGPQVLVELICPNDLKLRAMVRGKMQNGLQGVPVMERKITAEGVLFSVMTSRPLIQLKTDLKAIDYSPYRVNFPDIQDDQVIHAEVR